MIINTRGSAIFFGVLDRVGFREGFFETPVASGGRVPENT